MSDNQQNLAYRLPLDVLGVLAQHLAAQNLHATCASLNIASKAVREETTPSLWKTVMYRWNNDKNARKKRTARWKTVFESESAKYIQYLMAVPSSPSDVAAFRSPWEPPFLPAIIRKQNRLKACIIAGKWETICIFLYDSYQPRSLDMRMIMVCTSTVQVVTGTSYTKAVFRFAFTDSNPAIADPPVDVQSLKDCFARKEKRGHLITLDLSIRFHNLCVWFQSPSTPREGYLSLALVEILTCIRFTAGIWAAGKRNNPEIVATWPGLRFIFKGAGLRDVLAIGNAINAAYAHTSDFGHIMYEVNVRDTLTHSHIRSFLRKIERNYVNIQPESPDEAPLPVVIRDQPRNGGGGESTGGLEGVMTFDVGTRRHVRGIGIAGGDLSGRALSRKADDEASSEGSDVEEDL